MSEKDLKKIRNFAKEKLPEYFLKNHVEVVANKAKWLASFYPEADKPHCST